jgi:hypothetical protein
MRGAHSGAEWQCALVNAACTLEKTSTTSTSPRAAPKQPQPPKQRLGGWVGGLQVENLHITARPSPPREKFTPQLLQVVREAEAELQHVRPPQPVAEHLSTRVSRAPSWPRTWANFCLF